jgi:hypothetical protein
VKKINRTLLLLFLPLFLKGQQLNFFFLGPALKGGKKKWNVVASVFAPTPKGATIEFLFPCPSPKGWKK